MATRKPTYIDPVGGELVEMSPTADAIAVAAVTINGTPAAPTDAVTVAYVAANAAPVTVKTVELLLPAAGVYEYSQQFTDAAVNANSHIVSSISGEAPSGKDYDEVEMDRPFVKVYPQAGSVLAYIQGTEGLLGGAFRISYISGS